MRFQWKLHVFLTLSSSMLEGKIERYVEAMINNVLAKLCFDILNTQLKQRLRERLRDMLKLWQTVVWQSFVLIIWTHSWKHVVQKLVDTISSSSLQLRCWDYSFISNKHSCHNYTYSCEHSALTLLQVSKAKAE